MGRLHRWRRTPAEPRRHSVIALPLSSDSTDEGCTLPLPSSGSNRTRTPGTVRARVRDKDDHGVEEPLAREAAHRVSPEHLEPKEILRAFRARPRVAAADAGDRKECTGQDPR